MINVNDFKTGITIKLDNDIYQVIEFQHVKPGKGAAFVRTTLKNLRTGATIEKTFNSGIKVETARIERRDMQFLYSMGNTYYFSIFHRSSCKRKHFNWSDERCYTRKRSSYQSSIIYWRRRKNLSYDERW